MTKMRLMVNTGKAMAVAVYDLAGRMVQIALGTYLQARN